MNNDDKCALARVQERTHFLERKTSARRAKSVNRLTGAIENPGECRSVLRSSPSSRHGVDAAVIGKTDAAVIGKTREVSLSRRGARIALVMAGDEAAAHR
jgi:hypothetical protein